MTFQLDTSGHFHRPNGSAVYGNPADTILTWSDLSPFAQGYIEALFADLHQTPVVQECGRGGWVVGFSDFAPETLARIVSDCAARENDFGFGMDSANDGAGFWGRRQDGASRTFPPLTVQLGDDGKVRFA